jgi:hypothetical protein
MISRPMKMAIAAFFAGAMVLGTASIVSASVKSGTTVKGKLAAGTQMIFEGQIDGGNVTVTCTSFKASGTVTSKDKTTMDIAPVTIKGCTDSLGGNDTVKTNDTNGSWELKASPESGGATPLSLVVPKAGAIFTTSVLPGCKITVAPTKAASIAGSYNEDGVDQVTNASFAVAGNAICSASTSEATSTVDFSPNPGTIPPFVS